MFSDQYKQECDKLKLSEEYMQSLSSKLKQERDKLEKTNKITQTEKPSLFATLLSKKNHMVPLLACTLTCVVIVVLAVSQLLNNYSKSDSEELIKYSMSCDLATDNTAVDSDASEEALEESGNEDVTSNIMKNQIEENELKIASNESQLEKSTQDSAISLKDTVESLKLLPKDKTMASLDYANNQRLILHGSWGLLIYNLQDRRIEKAVDFSTEFGDSYETQIPNVQVYNAGTLCLITYRNKEDSPAQKSYFLYDIDNETITETTYQDFLTLNAEMDQSLTYDTTRIDDIISANNHSKTLGSEESTSYTLFYLSKSWDCNVSLCIYVNHFDSDAANAVTEYANDAASGITESANNTANDVTKSSNLPHGAQNLLPKDEIIPIFGNDTYELLSKNGYTTDGIYMED